MIEPRHIEDKPITVTLSDDDDDYSQDMTEQNQAEEGAYTEDQEESKAIQDAAAEGQQDLDS